MTVHLLYVGSYEDRTVVGVYASRELCDAEILRRAHARESLEAVQVEAVRVVES